MVLNTGKIRQNVLNFYIEILKQRLDTINQLRINRALADMRPAFQQIYILLPTLLHYHHPMMPGYLEDNVPHGVSFFTPNENQQQMLQNLTYGQPFKFSNYIRGKEHPITGIYSMGSTSSIGQSSVSDLDIWICHQSWLNDNERFNLKRKCTLLKKWCVSMGMEVSFFLIDENKFRHRKNISLDKEDCDSIQHILLLDEFYRTAVRMAGKRILWNIVPGEKENHYDEYVMSLYANSVLTPNEWLDLGGLGRSSVKDYFNATLLQLYKSLNSPYKAVLKTLLIEAYIWEYPNTQFLATDIKQCLHNGKVICFGLDPYCMMLERITRYLTMLDDSARLDLVRRCFYLKVAEKISDENRYQASTDWRWKILSQLVKEWDWDNNKLNILNNRSKWKIERVRDSNTELLNAMTKSYQNLMCFANRNNSSINIKQQDIKILINKLSSTFEILPKEVISLTSQVSQNFGDKKITFIYIPSKYFNIIYCFLCNELSHLYSIINFYILKCKFDFYNSLVEGCFYNILNIRFQVCNQSNNFYSFLSFKKIFNNSILDYFSFFLKFLYRKYSIIIIKYIIHLF